MLQVTTTTHAARFVLALTVALAVGPVTTATASPVSEPSTTSSTSSTGLAMAGWQDAVTELAAQARSTSSLAARRMLRNELTMVMHSHRDW